MPSHDPALFPPLADEEMSAAQSRLVESYRRGDFLSNVVRVFARHTELFAAYKPFGLFAMRGSSLPPRLRELAILRIGVLNHCDYEWSHHVEISRAAGVPDEVIERVRRGSADPAWSEAERAVLVATEALHARADVPAPAMAELARWLLPQQVFELVATVGNYVMITMILNTFEVPLEPGYVRLDGTAA